MEFEMMVDNFKKVSESNRRMFRYAVEKYKFSMAYHLYFVRKYQLQVTLLLNNIKDADIHFSMVISDIELRESISETLLSLSQKIEDDVEEDLKYAGQFVVSLLQDPNMRNIIKKYGTQVDKFMREGN